MKRIIGYHIVLWGLSSCLRHCITEILFWRFFFYVIKKELTNSVICYPLPFSFIRSVHMFRFSSVCSTKHDFSELYNFRKLQFFSSQEHGCIVRTSN